jgi:hypothetical protein
MAVVALDKLPFAQPCQLGTASHTALAAAR